MISCRFSNIDHQYNVQLYATSSLSEPIKCRLFMYVMIKIIVHASSSIYNYIHVLLD